MPRSGRTLAPSAHLAALALALVSLAACGIPTKQTRVQEAAYELNMTLRFSRADGVLDKVAKDSREKFLARHKQWHDKVRIDDVELAGITLREDSDANLFLNVGWHRADESDVRQTVILQRWHDNKGAWVLADESRAQGDVGLFGEPMVVTPADDTGKGARDLQFRTTVIRSSE